MSIPNLTTTSYVVLGLIALRGASTSYDLKRALRHSIGYFWPFPHAQLYAEPARLAELGLLREEQEDHGRRRRLYELTDAGKAALQDWLSAPVDEIFELRDIAQLKLFFGELMNGSAVVALARRQVELHRERLAEYKALTVLFGNHPRLARRMAPLRYGRLIERAAVEFWQQIAAEEAAALETAPAEAASAAATEAP